MKIFTVIAVLFLLVGCFPNEIDKTKDEPYKDTTYGELLGDYEFAKETTWSENTYVVAETVTEGMIDEIEITQFIYFKDQEVQEIVFRQEAEGHSTTTTFSEQDKVNYVLETIYNQEPVVTEIDALYDATEYLVEEYIGAPVDEFMDEIESGIRDAIGDIF